MGPDPFGQSEPYKRVAERPITRPKDVLRRAGSDRDKWRTKALTHKYMNNFLLQKGGGLCAKYIITVRIVSKIYQHLSVSFSFSTSLSMPLATFS